MIHLFSFIYLFITYESLWLKEKFVICFSLFVNNFQVRSKGRRMTTVHTSVIYELFGSNEECFTFLRLKKGERNEKKSKVTSFGMRPF